MKKIALLCVVALGLSTAAAYPTPVVTTNWAGATATNYTVAGNWNPAGVPNAAFDNVIVNNATTMVLPASGSYTIGQLNVLGTASVRISAGSTATFTVTNADNLTGNVSILTGNQTNSSSMTWNVYGDWRLGTVNNAFDVGVQQLNLYGSNNFVQKGSQVASSNPNGIYGAATNGFVINANVYGNYANDLNSGQDLRTWRFQNLKVKSAGSITGGFWVVRTLQVESGGQLLKNPANPTDFLFFGQSNSTAANNDNTNVTTGYGGGKLALPGGVVFPNNVQLSTGYAMNSNPAILPLYVWKMASSAQSINVGDLYVNGSFFLGRWGVGFNSNYASPGVNATYYIAAFNPVDNDATGTPRNAYIKGDFQIGGSNLVHRGILYIDNTNTSSVIQVGGNVNIGHLVNGAMTRTGTQHQPSGSVHLGGGTVQVGGDWRVFREAARGTTSFLYTNWNAGTSTVIFDGNGTVKTQTLYADNMPFNNLIVRTKGTVTGSTYARDDIRLTGSLTVDCGTFAVNGRNVTFTSKGAGLTVKAPGTLNAGTAGSTLIFQGGGNDCNTADFISTADPATSVGAVQIKAGSPTFVQLLTDVKVLSLTMDNGCALVLNGHTLTVGATPLTDTMEYPTGSGAWIYKSWSDAAAIPEPGTMLLVGTGALAALGYLRRRRLQ